MENAPFDGGTGPELDRRLDAMNPAELEAFIDTHSQIIANCEHKLLSAYAALERRDSHRTDGCNDLASWIQTRTYCERPTAREQARVAASLIPLPDIRARYAAGRLCFDQVRQLTRFATADTDTEWADKAPAMTSHQLRQVANRHHHRSENTAEHSDADDAGQPDPSQQRSLTHRHLADGRFRYTITLPGLEGATTLAALQRQANKYGPDAETGGYTPWTERLADAYVDLITAANPSKSADRSTVVIHIPHQPDNSDDGKADGYGAYHDHPFTGPITDQDIDLLGCHSRIHVSIDNLDGHPVGIGKLSKQWPAWLFHSIWHRDHGCRWPGCTNTVGLAVHHEKPWSHPKGRTDYDAGFLLCSRHHRFRHKQNWKIEGDPRHTLTFIRPDGTTYHPKPEPIPPHIQTRLHNLGFETGPEHEAG